jgi:Clp amino terminal domain, pathogenicity island component
MTLRVPGSHRPSGPTTALHLSVACVVVDQVAMVRPGSSVDSCQRDVSYCHRDGPTEGEKGGGSMFERFTDRARRVVVLAQEEARMLNHNYIGTEQILLGLIREGDGVAA